MYDSIFGTVSTSFRDWRGNQQTATAMHRRYEFPVTTYRIKPNGEREVIRVEAANR